MQAITGTVLSNALKINQTSMTSAPSENLLSNDWATMYNRIPNGNSTLFELEALVAKRMELLAWIDQITNSPQAKSYDSILDRIASRLPQERRTTRGEYFKGTVLGYGGDTNSFKHTLNRHSSLTQNAAAMSGELLDAAASTKTAVVFDKDEDLVSHLLCRYAFCMSERWRKWFIRTEETLLRARLKVGMINDPFNFLLQLMKNNGLPCVPLSEQQRGDPVFQEYLDYRRYKADATKESESKAQNYYSIPFPLATRLIKNRTVLCRAGRAILFRDQVQEVFLTLFKGQLDRGLHEAYLVRMKQQNVEDDNTSKLTVMHMLDAFLEQFIANPADGLQEGAAGSVTIGDVQRLSLTHFPPCMRQIDLHLRREGHLKHHGRFSYGLFLKAIGLTLESSLAFFAALMTEKGGGSVEAFSKTAYGYNVRHNYGMEGKKMSYSSYSCATILGLPPVVDKHDCHGCPFRFRDESALRLMLQRDQPSPLGKGYPDVRPSAMDIEDIIADCKGQHYTRACYKYFMATHSGARRDTLFRSPYEYYCCSRDMETESINKESINNIPLSVKTFNTPVKRTDTTPALNEEVIRQRT